jgi:hypothetical protein
MFVVLRKDKFRKQLIYFRIIELKEIREQLRAGWVEPL